MDNVETQKKKVLSLVASLKLIKLAIITTSQGVPFGVNCEVNTDALPNFEFGVQISIKS